jgi:hypothetical protein
MNAREGFSVTRPSTAGQIWDDRSGDVLNVTRLGIIDRLADPYLTEHDRWVLRQFARFLSGIAPEPDPRVVEGPRAHRLHPPGRWTRV